MPRILFAVPSLALLKQTLDDWSFEVDSAFTALGCNALYTKVSARSDAPADSTVDLPIPATTRPTPPTTPTPSNAKSRKPPIEYELHQAAWATAA